MNKLFFFALTSFHFVNSISIAQSFWEQTNGPLGGTINSITEISGDKILSASDYGVFISTNEGNNWSNAGLNDLSVKCVSANISGDLFAGMYGSGGVFRSTNDGENWIQSGLEDEGVMCLKIFNNVLYAGLGNYYPERGGLYRSTDSGLNWSYLGFLNNSIRAVHVNQNGDIYAAAYDGLYKSSDDGVSWFEVLQLYSINSIEIKLNGKIFLCNGSDYVWRSTDEGNTWDQLNQGFGLYNPQLLAVHTDQKIYALTEFYNFLTGFRGIQIFQSTNDGDIWTPMSQNDLEVQANSFIINSVGNVYLGTYWKGIFSSNNLGVNWSQKNNGLNCISVNVLDIDSNGKIYAGTYGNSLFYSINNGESWENIRVSLNGAYIFGLLLINDQTIMATTNAGAYLTTDEGANWIYKGLQYNSPHDLLFTLNEDVFVSSYSDGIYFSSNYGDTWSLKNNGLTTNNIGSLALTTNQNLFAGTNTGIFRSTDNGENWVKKSNGLNNNPAFVVIATSGDILYTGTPFGKVYKSTNYGDTWISKSNGLPNTLINNLIEVQNAGIYAGTNEGVFYSSNEGENWIQLNTGLTSHRINFFILDKEQHLLGATSQGVIRTVNQVTSTEYPTKSLPESLVLLQNYPNPFNPSTRISYQLPVISEVVIKIYDVLGNEVAALVDEYKPAGTYEVEWNASGYPSGVYFYQLRTENFIETKKMVLMK